MASTSFSNGTVIEPSWLNSVNASAYLARMRNVKMDPYNAVGDGVTDDYAAIQAVIDDGYIPFLPRGVFAHSQPFILKDNTGIIGSSCFWKRRTSYVYSGSNQSVLKYTGTTGTNTCSIRASALAVGTAGTDFTGPDTDDLINIVLDGIHIDGQGVDYPLYMYRCGNGGIVGNVTVEGGKKYNCVIMGIYDASWGHIGVYECQGSGIAIGKDVFSWGSVESTCFNLKLTVSTANNGTVHTYVAGTATDLDNCGIEAYCGRGCELWIDSEANYGRAGVLSQYNQANVTGGTTIYHPSYAEGNADGYAIIYRDAMDGIEISEGFIHPGNTAWRFLGCECGNRRHCQAGSSGKVINRRCGSRRRCGWCRRSWFWPDRCTGRPPTHRRRQAIPIDASAHAAWHRPSACRSRGCRMLRGFAAGPERWRAHGCPWGRVQRKGSGWPTARPP